MEKIVNSLFHFGGLIRGFPPTISPTLEDFEMMQYIWQPLKPATSDFRILIAVDLFQPHEVEIHLLDKKLLEFRMKHDKRQNAEGLWMTRDCVYTYELPPTVCGKELHAEWSEDNYLLIQATSSNCEETGDKIKIVPQHVQSILKPVVEIGVLKEMMEDIRDRSKQVLRYIRFHSQNSPITMEIKDSSKTGQESKKPSEVDLSNRTGVKVDSSEKDSSSK